jgi:hypothetical protein
MSARAIAQRRGAGVEHVDEIEPKSHRIGRGQPVAATRWANGSSVVGWCMEESPRTTCARSRERRANPLASPPRSIVAVDNDTSREIILELVERVTLT